MPSACRKLAHPLLTLTQLSGALPATRFFLRWNSCCSVLVGSSSARMRAQL